MVSAPPARLSDLLSGTRRLALVGLAKNTGKTETLTAILAEHASAGRPVGVTSIGRDGEEHDVIDARIQKPRLHLVAGSLVATTSELLRASGVSHERLERTGVRTPLGADVAPNASATVNARITAPSVAGTLTLTIDLVREGVGWFGLHLGRGCAAR